MHPMREAEEQAEPELDASPVSLLLALGAGVAAAILAAFVADFTGKALTDAEDATVTAQIVEERHQQIVGCISQYGPGERWARTDTPKCAPMVEAPAYVMIPPVSP